jgi:hypothetical protein
MALAEGFNRRSTMAEYEVRSPHTVTRDTPHPRRNETGEMHRGPFNERADSGHRAGHVGKAASSPASLRRGDQTSPVQGMPPGVVPDRRR